MRAGPELVTGSRLRYYLVEVEEVPSMPIAIFAEDEIEPEG